MVKSHLRAYEQTLGPSIPKYIKHTSMGNYQEIMIKVHLISNEQSPRHPKEIKSSIQQGIRIFMNYGFKMNFKFNHVLII